MSLLSTDIKKVKKLSLREAKPSTHKDRVRVKVEPTLEELVIVKEATPKEEILPYPALKPATGRLAELEDIFVRDRTIKQRQEIIRLLDRCKRYKPTLEDIKELELLIQPLRK